MWSEKICDCRRRGFQYGAAGPLEKECAARGIAFYRPTPILCTDNAAMIGAAAYYEFCKGVRHGYDLNAIPNLKLGERA